MREPKLDEVKTWLVPFLLFYVIGSFCFALIGLFKLPSQPTELDDQTVLETIRPVPVPELETLVEQLEQAGYYVHQQVQNFEIELDKWENSGEAWIQGHETWILVPSSHEQNLTQSVLGLCSKFLEDGWVIQIEGSKQGYTLGFWGTLPKSGHRVLTYFWDLQLLTPHNYAYYGLNSLPAQRGEVPKLAMIIDDWGYDTPANSPLIAYPLPLTIAVLPHLVVSKEMSELAYAAGHEVILHQPMEALNSSLDLGPGGITVGMNKWEVAERLKENLASLPVVSGLNNHMGSRVTEDPETMAYILEAVKEQGLFFVDSRTSNYSVAPAVASELGVPFGVNNLFLDNENDVEIIKEQVRKGIDLAKRKGHAVVIGHVRPATAEALWEMLPELLASGVEFVPVSELIQDSLPF